MFLDSMLKRSAFSALIAVSLLSAGSAATSVAALDRAAAASLTAASLPASAAIKNADSTGADVSFTVRSTPDGVIGVFGADGSLEYKLEVYIKTLPAKDREMLVNGITAHSREELYEIIGDYTA